MIDVDYNAAEISAALAKQLKHGRYEPSHLVGDGKAGRRIAEILSKCEFRIQKKLSYISEA